MSINTQSEFERLNERLAIRLENYQNSVKELAPSSVRNKRWELVLHAQLEVELIIEEIERVNRIRTNHSI